MISKNLYNVVPFHASDSEWYKNKRTYHGVDRFPILPLGQTPNSILKIDGMDASLSATMKIINCVTDQVVTSVTVQPYYRVPPRETTPVMMQLRGATVFDVEEGVYYAELNYNGEVYYSEPWRWADVKDMVRISYSRTNEMDASGVKIHFFEPFNMCIPSEIMMPEYKYESTVEELDGYMFVRKKVSYKEHRCSFLCTDYFAEAVRLLWHCNEVVISQHGEKYVVNYMDAPQPSWSDDNHLMEMEIKFRTDTITQTNGESLDNIAVTAKVFNGSFDESFDESYQ